MHNYAFYVLLNATVQEKSDQDMNQWKKNKKRSNLQILVCSCHASPGTTFPAWRELQVLLPVWPKPVAMATNILPGKMSPEQQMSPWREWRNREHVFGHQSLPEWQMSPWQEMSCLATKGGLGQVDDDDVAETHWQNSAKV